MKILHIADVHWRGLSRHQEYKEQFQKLILIASELAPDVIYVGGDIVHSKTQGISPELIENLSWWFTALCEVCPVHMILGNHDGLLNNTSRQDAITPIVQALGIKNLFLYKESGVYPTGHKGFNWCVFSCFDEPGWKRVSPVEGEINIALYHGAVKGSKTDQDWEIEGEVSLGLFSRYDFAMLGDIHKRQFLDLEGRIAYCGSTIQQNYGESPDKGFLFWEIESRDSFKCTFYPIENDWKFITHDWKGTPEATANSCNGYHTRSRLKIESGDHFISPGDIKRFNKLVKFSEVQFRIDNKVQIKSQEEMTSSLDLRDPQSQRDLFRSYLKEKSFTKEEWKILDDLIVKSLENIKKTDESSHGSLWSIDRMSWNNTFSYGEGNEIDFKKLSGITGIFGKNARGKSSIIGTLAYGLFNDTDRGSMKNASIMGRKKSECSAEVDITIDGSQYRVIRKTQRKISKSGEYAPTSLDIFKIDNGSLLSLAEEQRRETEKTLRSLIGTFDDFCVTSLATQGGMNTFISQKSSVRKSIIARFCDLTLYEEMSSYAKGQLTLSQKMASAVYLSSEKYEEKISQERKALAHMNDLLESLEEKLEVERKLLEDMIYELSTCTDTKSISQEDIDSAKKKLHSKIDKKEEMLSQTEQDRKEIAKDEETILKIDELIQKLDITSLREKQKILQQMERTYSSLYSAWNEQKKEVDSLTRSREKLKTVPCGDSFPSCIFIKDAHDARKNLPERERNLIDAKNSLNDIEFQLNEYRSQNISDSIEKHSKLLEKKSTLTSRISQKKQSIARVEMAISHAESEIQSLQSSYDDLLARKRDQSESKEAAIVSNRIAQKKKLIKDLDSDRIRHHKEIEVSHSRLESLIKSMKESEELSRINKMYDVFIQATSNKGIPLQLMREIIPKINRGIEDILKGVVPFVITLESEESSNSLDVCIDNGEGKIPVEAGSGMEKMTASLAIRIALANITTLPKCPVLIIDEGFGTLDEMNMEAFMQLLHQLKNNFNNVIVISHMDMIKDSVDSVIEVEKIGEESYVSL